MRVPLDAACAVAEVQPATIRQWVARGLISRTADGYDLVEILEWLDTRNASKVRTLARS